MAGDLCLRRQQNSRRASKIDMNPTEPTTIPAIFPPDSPLEIESVMTDGTGIWVVPKLFWYQVKSVVMGSTVIEDVPVTHVWVAFWVVNVVSVPVMT